MKKEEIDQYVFVFLIFTIPTLLLFWVMIETNQSSTGIYDELIGPDQVPHHELIESGYPFVAYTYWTRCTTGGGINRIWVYPGVLYDFILALPLSIISMFLVSKVQGVPV